MGKSPSRHSVPNEAVELLTDESLKIFIDGMKEFDRSFCELMAGGSDFTIRLEVRGNVHKLLHCRTYHENIRRPKDAGANKKAS